MQRELHRAFDAEFLREELRKEGRASLRMQGMSMAPLLPQGTRVKLRSLRPGEDLTSAIVAFEAHNRVVVHVVVESSEQHQLTQGVASSKRDARTERDQVIGVVQSRAGWPIHERGLRLAATGILRIRALLSRT